MRKSARKSLIGDQKVNMDFFEKEENRKHYFPAMIEIARVNLAPFFINLIILFIPSQPHGMRLDNVLY